MKMWRGAREDKGAGLLTPASVSHVGSNPTLSANLTAAGLDVSEGE